MKCLLTLTVAAIGLAGCATVNGDDMTAEPASGASAIARLVSASGAPMGTATVTQVSGALQLRVDGMNLPSGAHGVHIHQVGNCTAPDFTSAGPHWNPTGAQHGKDNPAGMHMGDLPNLLVGSDGRGTLEYRIAGATLTGGDHAMLDSDGAAIVIHATADDYRTDPAGNSGARIACGVFQ